MRLPVIMSNFVGSPLFCFTGTFNEISKLPIPMGYFPFFHFLFIRMVAANTNFKS
jgi:hypothetical protein